MWMRTLPFARKFRFMDADDFFRFVGDRTFGKYSGISWFAESWIEAIWFLVAFLPVGPVSYTHLTLPTIRLV